MPFSEKYYVLLFPIRQFIFYITALIVWKLIFIGYNEVPELINPLLAGVRLDTSMICGVFLVGFIPYCIFLMTGWKTALILFKYLHLTLWLIVSIVAFSSILLYKEWGSTLDTRAVSYVLHPNEAWASVKDFIPFHLVFWGLIILVSGYYWLRLQINTLRPIKSAYFTNSFYLVILGAFSFLGLRGGWQKLPIVPSDAFYSTEMKNNFAATNSVWYFLYSLKKSTKISPQYPNNAIKKYEKGYLSNYCNSDSLSGIWKSKHIILIIAEGWSADMVEYLYAKDKVTPFFDSLCQHSVRFTNAFSTGFRTDQGLMSIISGIPSIQSTNMPNIIDKARHYPSLPAIMQSQGRKTSFIYGGDLNFSNLFNYLTLMKFDTIIRDKDFNTENRTTDWGVPDHITVDKAVEVMNQSDGLFFSTLLLLSSHSPFEVPIPNKFSEKSGIRAKYMSSVAYSDMAIRRFFEHAKRMAWYNDAIFIITSDHGSTHSGWAGMSDHNRFRIPLIVFDPQMTFGSKEREYNLPCNHFDIPKTICNMMGMDGNNFLFGRNIFCNDSNRKAYWNVDTEAGYYGLNQKEITPLNVQKDTILKESILFLDMVKNWFNQL